MFNVFINFIQRIAREKDFQTYYRPLYHGIRLIFWRIVNIPTIKISFIDEEKTRYFTGSFSSKRPW